MYIHPGLKMLNYRETNWRYREGLETRNYRLLFNQVLSRQTVQEQKKRTERLSLVKFFRGSKRSQFLDICHNFKKNDIHFFFDENKRFHITLLGFPVVNPLYYEKIREKINQFIELTQTELEVNFNVIRLGTKYENKNTLKPVSGVSNGTIIAIGRSISNKKLTNYGNMLTSFLLNDKNLSDMLGKKFRRRFPTVWCTMGYYTTDFVIQKDLETLFNKYKNLNKSFFQIPCCEVELGLSHYKDLRDWKSLEKFKLSGSLVN
jgi:hypothetical protein